MSQTVAAVLHRSYSQINQLRTCGEQYRLERIEHAPSRPSCAAVGGTAVHSGTELVDHIMHSDPKKGREEVKGWGKLEADKALDASIVKYQAKDWPIDSWRKYGRQDVAWFRETGIPQSIDAYVDWRFDNPEFVLANIPGFGPAIEVPFNYYIEDQLIHGWIDRIFTNEDGTDYYPIDLKSGRKPTTDEQLGLYAAALKASLGWDVTWGYYLYALKSGTAKVAGPLRVNHWTPEKLRDVYLPATRLIEQGIYMPHPGESCYHCGVSASCQFVQAAI